MSSPARSLLPPQRQEALTTFMEISSLNDEDLCISILQNHSWNVDQAISEYLGADVAPPEQEEEFDLAHAFGAPYRRPTASSSSNSSSSRGTVAPSAPPASAAASSIRPSAPPASAASAGGARGAAPPQGNALDALLRPLKWLFSIREQHINPTQDARKFISDFDQTYSPGHAPFCDNSFQAAVQQAHQASRFLVVYLHSPVHEDTSKFCRQVLCTRNVTMVLGDNAVTWAGSVWAPEAYELSLQLRASCFPFVAVLVCPSAREFNVVDRIQGYLDEQPFTQRLEACIRANSQALAAVRLSAARRDESSQLRAQQDREFRAMEESTRQEAERREREARERVAREEEERRLAQAAERAEQERREQREVELQLKKDSVACEPENGPDVTTVRFQLPTGAKLSRRFAKDCTVQLVHDFLDLHFAEARPGVITRFAVSSHFPKAQLTDMGATLEQLVSTPTFRLFPCAFCQPRAHPHPCHPPPTASHSYRACTREGCSTFKISTPDLSMSVLSRLGE